MSDKFKKIIERRKELEDLLSSGTLPHVELAKVSKEYSKLEIPAKLISALFSAEDQLKQAEEMRRDPELADMAEEEVYTLKPKIEALNHQIKLTLLPRDEADDRNIIMEIRAGTGGDEASLFVADLFRMYQGYAAYKGWGLSVLDANESDLKGYKEIVFEMTGQGVYARMKFESGTHRVQRVPETESSGRIHTSAATIAVMPEAEEVDININPADLKIDTFRASGAGGQHVNKVESAIRITHLPTGAVAQCQEERSQHKNREKAMKMLYSRIYEAEREKLASERTEMRKVQVGSGDRSERIRTYNFPQSRLTDHRIGLTLYKLDAILLGEGLEEVIEALIQDHQLKLLANIGE